MIRPTHLAAAAALCCAGTVLAQSQAQAENPLVCLYNQADPKVRDRITELHRQKFTTTGSSASAVSSFAHGAIIDEVNRCMASRNWRLGQRGNVVELLSAEYSARFFESHLVNLGFDVTQLRSWVSTLPALRAHDVASDAGDNLKPGAPQDLAPELKQAEAQLLRPLEQRTGRTLTPQQLEIFWNAVKYRAYARYFTLKFVALNEAYNGPYLVEESQIVPALRANMPALVPRTLANEDRKAMRKLAAEYRAYENRTAARLAALTDYANSGDREAILILRDTLMLGVPTDVYRHYSSRLLLTDHLSTMTRQLAAVWTAQLWVLHGYEEAGRPIITRCLSGFEGYVKQDKANGTRAFLGGDGVLYPVNTNGQQVGSTWESCGFELLAKSAYRRENGKLVKQVKPGERVHHFWDSASNRKESGDFVVTGARFANGDNADTEARFQKYLLARSRGEYLTESGGSKLQTNASAMTDSFYRQYARDTGRSSLIDLAEAGKRAELEARFAAEKKRKQERWDSAVAEYKANTKTPAAQDKLRDLASSLGMEYYGKYIALVPQAAPAASSTRQTITGVGSQQVEVRQYDSSGTYQGSTRTSSFWADVLKTTSPPPR